MARIDVLHNIPGRLRVRLPANTDAAQLERAVREHPGVSSCRRSTHSLLVQYQSTATTADSLLQLIASLIGIAPVPSADGRDGAAPAVRISPMIIGAVAALNGGVARFTGNHVDARTLLAIGLAMWAARQVFRRRPFELQWSTAIWYAYQLFRQHNASVTAQAARAANGGQPGTVVSGVSSGPAGVREA